MFKTIYCFAYVGISMLFLTPFGITSGILQLLRLRKLMTKFMILYGRTWARSIIKLTGCKVEAEGTQNIPDKDGVCFISNHCGFFDIVLLWAYCSRPLGFIAKREFIYFPLLNYWIYITGGLFLDRKSPRKAIHTISKGAEKLQKGGSMVIFPEGHRSRGQGLLPFRTGSLKLATLAKTTIIPVAIKGSYETFEKTGRVMGVPVNIAFCDPIDTTSLPIDHRKQLLSEKVYSVIKEKLDSWQ